MIQLNSVDVFIVCGLCIMDQKIHVQSDNLLMLMNMQRLVDQSSVSNNFVDVCSAEVIAASKARMEPNFIHHWTCIWWLDLTEDSVSISLMSSKTGCNGMGMYCEKNTVPRPMLAHVLSRIDLFRWKIWTPIWYGSLSLYESATRMASWLFQLFLSMIATVSL